MLNKLSKSREIRYPFTENVKTYAFVAAGSGIHL